MPETKEELQARIAELEAHLNELSNQMAARDAMLAQTGEDGFLITTPNQKYTGNTAGVKFENGRAFIPMSKPNAEQTARRLVNDFGYRMQQMTAKEYQELAPTPAEPKKPMGMEALVREGVR